MNRRRVPSGYHPTTCHHHRTSCPPASSLSTSLHTHTHNKRNQSVNHHTGARRTARATNRPRYFFCAVSRTRSPRVPTRRLRGPIAVTPRCTVPILLAARCLPFLGKGEF